MGKDPSRKPKRRAVVEPVIDDDLVELASVINEYKLDNNAKGWFELPWRSGWNAIRLMAETYERGRVTSDFATPPGLIGYRISSFLTERSKSQEEATNEVYWEASELRDELAGYARPLGCALRCLQVLIAKSDGGGHVYNDIVRPLYETLDPERYSGLVLDARCRDAIGVQAGLQNDRYDRQRRAFTIAWQRGLYHAAYSIQPVRP